MAIAEIIGQERALTLLRQALATGRVSHAYLFRGPEGVGKRTTALAVAAALNCPEATEGEACGLCLSCGKVSRALHPDVHTLAPQGAAFKIEQIRELTEEVSRSPYEGRRKVFILEGAERMTEQAQNALLKTLEEPTATTHLILISSQPAALLPTVLSRCQEVVFGPVPTEALGEYLERQRGMDQARAALVAALAEGSVGRALTMDPEALRDRRDRIVQETWEALRGGPLGILRQAEAWAKNRNDLPDSLTLLWSWFRDLLVVKISGRETLTVHRDRAAEIREMGKAFPAHALSSACDVVGETLDALAHYANTRLCLEAMFFRMAEALGYPGR